jgi:hypothetical protein
MNVEGQDKHILEHTITMTFGQLAALTEEAESRGYERGVTDGFDEAIYEVKRGEIDPQTYVRKTK